MNGFLKKAGLGVALAATALTAAAPAEAQRWGGYRHYNRGGGDAVAGALLGGVLGLGIGAAIGAWARWLLSVWMPALVPPSSEMKPRLPSGVSCVGGSFAALMSSTFQRSTNLMDCVGQTPPQVWQSVQSVTRVVKSGLIASKGQIWTHLLQLMHESSTLRSLTPPLVGVRFRDTGWHPGHPAARRRHADPGAGCRWHDADAAWPAGHS